MGAARAVSTDTVAIGLDMAPIESRFAEIGTFLRDSGHSVTDTRDTLEAVQRMLRSFPAQGLALA